MVILQEQVHRLSQVAAGHKCLPEHGVSAEVKPHAQLQAEPRVTGESQCITGQADKVAVFYPGANA